MTMDEQMTLAILPLLSRQFFAELQDGFHVLQLGRNHAGLRLCDVVKVEGDAVMRVIRIEGGRLGRAGIEKREDVGDAALAMSVELFEAANREQRKGGRVHCQLPSRAASA